MLRPHISVIARRFTFERTATAVFFVAVASVALLMPAQSDTWWHLRAGEDFWLRRMPPLHDTFSHTVHGGYWPNHEWLTQAVFFAVYRVGGIRLLTAVLAILTTVVWVIVWRLTPGHHLRRLVLLTLGIVPSSIVWSVRPQVLTLFCVALTAWLVAKRRDAWLPAVFLVWANLHGAVLLGIVMLLAAVFAAFIDDERARAPRFAMVAAACLAATLFTPLGVSFWTELPASLARIRQYDISEWRAPGFFDGRFLPFWIVAALLAAFLVIRRRHWRVAFANPVVCASLALTPLAVSAERNISAFMLVAVPALAYLIDLNVPMYAGARPRRERPAFNLAVVMSAAAASIGVVAYAWTVEWARLGWHPIPDAAIASVSSCPERLYNRYDEGGYLIWFARRQVFLDGRQDPYPPELVREQVRVETSGEYESTFQRYGIGCAFVPSESVLARRLVDSGWRTAYRSAAWSVLSNPHME